MILTQPRVSTSELERRTGWSLRPEGFCKAEICVPFRQRADGDAIDVEELADALRMPVLRDEPHGLWCLGPPASGRALETADAPDIVLPDLDGNAFALRSLRGQKVFVLAWASW